MPTTKIIAGKAYGSIPHLPGSKFGNRYDKGCSASMAELFTTHKRSPQDWITVTEKLDGSSVAVVNVNNRMVAVNKAGYAATSSPWVQHHLFDVWVKENAHRFSQILTHPGDRICGEWLAQAHGTRYDLSEAEPFVAFDIFRNGKRINHWDFQETCEFQEIAIVPVIWEGPGTCEILRATSFLDIKGKYHGLDMAEGCVWRLEHEGEFEALAKYVIPEKEIGKYLPEVSGRAPVWNLPGVWG